MPFEKAKVLKAAEKFLSQGKIKDAIKEYRQIAEHDEDDFTILNMLGDLHARAGQKDEAVSCFIRIADHYREQEFTLKAIAMYKKIEKLKPRDPQVAAKLATLYSNQGLLVDARAQWLIVADAYTRAGEPRKTLTVLNKVADLDPNNTEVRLKLAEGYLKERMEPEAARAFSDAAARLLEHGEFKKSLEANTKVLELVPYNMQALRGVASAHTALGTASEAAELLERALAEHPDDAEIVSMLAHAHLEAGNPAGAERAVATLVAKDSGNYRHYIEVAGSYLKAGDNDEAARILGLIIETMLAAREESDLLELVQQLLARNPDHVAGLRLLSRINWWQRDMDQLRLTLERLATSAQAAELPDEERYALTQLVRLAPDEDKYLERLNLLGGFSEDTEKGLMEEPAEASVPTFDGFDIVDEAAMEVGADETVTSEFEFNAVTDDNSSHAGVSFADLNEADEVSADGVFPVTEIVEHGEIAFDAGEQTFAHEPPAASPDSAETSKHHAILMQELESVDFYIAQGYSDIATDTLELLQQQFGATPEINARREKLNKGMPAADEVDAVQFNDAVIELEPEPAAPVSPVIEFEPVAPVSKGSGIDSGLAEIFEEFRMEAEGEAASSNEDFETHYNMATAYKEMELLDEAIREFQTAAGLTAPADGTPRYFQCCNMLGQCFVVKGMPQAAVLWFKKGLEAPGRSSEEYKAVQYELGSAYEQMGDLSRAVGVFTEVYGLDVRYRDVSEKLQSLQARRDTQGKKKKNR